jgi:hypothetical protein
MTPQQIEIGDWLTIILVGLLASVVLYLITGIVRVTAWAFKRVAE